MDVKKKFLLFLVGGSLFITGVSAFAALGGSLQSVEQDRARIAAEVKTSAMTAKYLVQEITKPGLTLHEYVNTQGQVFAISWIGIRHPDLKDLLGSYAGEVESTQHGMQGAQARSSHVALQSKNVYVEKYGHMRAARGRVILPALLPQGVDENEVQ